MRDYGQHAAAIARKSVLVALVSFCLCGTKRGLERGRHHRHRQYDRNQNASRAECSIIVFGQPAMHEDIIEKFVKISKDFLNTIYIQQMCNILHPNSSM
jgi:hypothetical protein